MKKQQNIKFFLSFVLILSNFSIAFSMHYCLHNIKNAEYCCVTEKGKKHCKTLKNKYEENYSCCGEVSYSDKNNKQVVSIQKVVPTLAIEVSQKEKLPNVNLINLNITNEQYFLKFFVESNAPPNYIKNSQLTFYET